MRPVVVVPSSLALLAAYASTEDPVADVRAAAAAAVSWLVERGGPRVGVVHASLGPADLRRGVREPAGLRIAAELLGAAGAEPATDLAGPLLAVVSGTATRTDRAPGHLDPRAEAYDAEVERALRAGDRSALAALDLDLAADLWAHDLGVLPRLAAQVGEVAEAVVDYTGAPHGVQHWVVRWTCAS